MLPPEFEARMRDMLGSEYTLFEKSLQAPPHQALRINTLKTPPGDFLGKAQFSLTPVPWAKAGYYYQAKDKPGKHPYHDAGAYYIQEPSAMAPAEYLGALPGERVLDLCASPGGKSTQIAADMQGQGILICNEIHPARAKILSENIERMGIANAVVTNETPERLLERFPAYFDRILVDAPCSGEGMFRKNEAAVQEWSPEHVVLCAQRQDKILGCAAGMLRAGGRLVYSTCTFAPEENEGSVSRFLNRFPEFSVLKAKLFPGMEPGRPEWEPGALGQAGYCARLFPHKLNGEGHFFAVLQKEGVTGGIFAPKGGEETGMREKECAEWFRFQKENLRMQREGNYLLFGDQLYLAPLYMPQIKGLKVLRPGLHLGTNKTNRFEPSHALALFLHSKEAFKTVNFSAQDPSVRAYLCGQEVALDGEAGWHLIMVDGLGIGWGKRSGGMIKNHYPKGLRKMY